MDIVAKTWDLPVAWDGRCYSDPANVPPNEDWQLPEGHYIPAKRPLTLVYPRPDVETSSDAKHRRHYPGLAYAIPVGASFGAWPYRYQLTTAPTGMVIGEIYGDVEYGVITWANPIAGTYTIAGTVTDQDGGVVPFEFELVITTSKALFIDSVTGSNANPGTLASPMLNNAGWHDNNASYGVYAGYHVYYRGGTHAITGIPANNGNIPYNTALHPTAFVAYPGESPVMNCSTGKFVGVGGGDIFIGNGLEFTDADQAKANAHYFWLTGTAVDRLCVFRAIFSDIGPGSIGDDNPSCVFVSDNSQRKSYFCYSDNTYSGLGFSSNGVACFIHYYTDDTLFERNQLINVDSRYGVWAKSHNDRCCMRANQTINDSDVGDGLLVMGFYGAELPDAVGEFCWNTLILPNANDAAIWLDHNILGGGDRYAYRNTIRGRLENRGPVEVGYDRLAENNIVVSDSADWLKNWTNSGSVLFATSAGALAPDGTLTGAARDAYFGTHGAEVG